MSAQHTPGPWFIWQELAMQREGCEAEEINDELLHDGEFCIYAGNPIECTRGSLRGHTAHICDVDADNFEFGDYDEAIKTTALANARLIAAAPDLVKTLEELSLYVAHNGDEWVRNKARDALAKATGAA